MNSDKGILLESGINELEIVEFEIGNVWFGINVVKVREIINFVFIIFVFNVYFYIEGIIELRGEVFFVVDIVKVLKMEFLNMLEKDKLIVIEFN